MLPSVCSAWCLMHDITRIIHRASANYREYMHVAYLDGNRNERTQLSVDLCFAEYCTKLSEANENFVVA